MHNTDRIILQGVRTHNLKDIDVQIPKNQITTITGVSGSGKSSLAFETIYKEGQFRYIESLSSYLRNFFSLGTRPEIDYSEGLSPAIAIEQNKRVANSRSSVGTITELDDYLRLLMTKCGNAYCYKCGTAMKPKNTEQIISEIRETFLDQKVYLLQEMKSYDEQADFAKFVRKNRKQTDAGEGITRYLVGTNRDKAERTYKNLVEYFYLEEPSIPHDAFPVQIFGIFDRIQVTEQTLGRLREDSIKMLARTEKFGVLSMDARMSPDESSKKEKTNSPLVKEGQGEIYWYTDKYYCPRDNISYPEFTTQHFSPNRQEGACPTCHGIGEQLQVDFDKVLDPNSPYINAILPWRDSNLGQAILKKLAHDYKFDENTLWKDIPLEYREVVLHGDGELHKINTGGDKFTSMYYKGVEDVLTSQYQKGVLTVDFQAMLDLRPCQTCQGAKLRQESLNVFLELSQTPSATPYPPYQGEKARLSSETGKTNIPSLITEGNNSKIKNEAPEGRRVGEGDIYISLAQESDAEAIVRMKHQSWLETYVNKQAKVSKKMIDERFAKRFDLAVEIAKNQIRSLNRVYVLKDNDRIVGVKYAVHKDEEDKWEYGGLYILKEYCGKGRGKKLHELAMQGFEDQDVYLSVANYNTQAIEFYKKLGFEILEDRTETTRFENGVAIESICMLKKASKFANHPYANPQSNRYNLHDLQRLPMQELTTVIASRKGETDQPSVLVERITKPLLDRASTVTNLGLGYLQTTRPVDTLSGGEIQRLRLAKQLGNKLTGIIYVLDEPTIGLDTKEIENTIKAIKGLKDMGNTIIVVEHNEEFIKESDYIVEIGPGAGDFGGNLIFQGPIKEFLKQDTLTAQYMTGRKQIHIEFEHKVKEGKVIRVRNAHKHNLKNVTVEFPLGGFTVITGGSGAGKTTLLHHTLFAFLEDKAKFIQSHIRLKLLKQGMSRQEIISSPLMKRELYENLEKEAIQEFYKHLAVDDILGFDQIENVLYVDQASIGKTPRSCPATFIGVFDDIRKLYAGATEAKMLGFDAGHFSFNSAKGACPECDGYGSKHIELQFLPDTYVPCSLCKGHRYKPEILSIKRHGKSIADILEMYVFDALDVFHDMHHISEPLELMCEIGLGYLKMGQAAHTLSGGESQRIKLVKHLLKSYRGHTMYFLDEPTVGLHPSDIEKLLKVMKKFLDNGDSIVMIEHEKNLLRFADKVIVLEDGKLV